VLSYSKTLSFNVLLIGFDGDSTFGKGDRLSEVADVFLDLISGDLYFELMLGDSFLMKLYNSKKYI